MADLNKGDTRLILSECQRQGLLRNQAAYVLATACWETAHTMEPVRETLASSDASAIARLDKAWERGQLKWVSRPYWRSGYFGRGYVQLTHEANYRKAGDKLGIDLVGNPSRALEPEIAAQILVVGSRDGWFTGAKLSDYITLQSSNYRGARRVINGTDKASVIAELARDYESELIAENYGQEPAPPVVNERRDGTQPRDSKLQSRTLWSQIMQWITGQGAGALALYQAQDEQTRLLIGVAMLIAFVAGIIIFRDRIKKWDGGVR